MSNTFKLTAYFLHNTDKFSSIVEMFSKFSDFILISFNSLYFVISCFYFKHKSITIEDIPKNYLFFKNTQLIYLSISNVYSEK